MKEYKSDVFSLVAGYPPSKETVETMRKQQGDTFNNYASLSDVNEVLVGSINKKMLEVERLLVLIKEDLAKVR
jgi:hypothetical protein